MTPDKFGGINIDKLKKIAGINTSNISKIAGKELFSGKGDFNYLRYRVPIFNFTGREQTQKHTYFSPDGKNLYITGEKSISSGTKAYLTGGTLAESNYSNWTSIKDGSFRVIIDNLSWEITGIDFTNVLSMNDIALTIQQAIRKTTQREETVEWITDHFKVTTHTTGSDFKLSVFETVKRKEKGKGTDISGQEWTDLNSGTVTNGTTTAYDNTFLQHFILRSAWDITTAMFKDYYDLGNNYPYITDCKGMCFNTLGNKLIVANAWEGGDNAETITSFTLSTPWDISTITHDGKFYDFSMDNINIHSLYLKENGSKLFALGWGDRQNARIIKYRFGINYDVSTLFKEANELDLNAQIENGVDMTINPNGDKIFVISRNLRDEPDTYKIYQYNLSIPFDLSSATYEKFFNPETHLTEIAGQFQLRPCQSISISPDGKNLYLSQDYGNKITQCRLLNEWDLGEVYSHPVFYFGNESQDSQALVFGNNGYKLYINNWLGKIFEYDLEIPYEINTSKYNSVSYDFSSIAAALGQTLDISLDGTKIIVESAETDKVYQIDLSTPWSLATASYNGVSLDASIAGEKAYGAKFSTDGTMLFLSSQSQSKIYRFDLSIAWDISSASHQTEQVYDFGFYQSYAGMTFSKDGEKIYITDLNDYKIKQHNLSIAWDLTTANPAYNKTFLVKDDNNQFPYIYDSAPKGICLSPNERKFYIIGKNDNYLWQLVFDNEA